MTFAELARLFAEEGDFDLVECADGLQITMHDFGAQLQRTVPWETVADWSKADVIEASMHMWEHLYRLAAPEWLQVLEEETR